MAGAKDVIILIPVYKNELTPTELMSLKRTIKVLRRHNIAFIKPTSLTLDHKFGVDNLHITTENFDDHYFQSIQGYNRLLISEEFYSRFTNYKYVLICQLDVYLLHDELMKWVNKDFDYLGAPWPAEEIRELQRHHLKGKLRFLRKVMRVVNFIFFNKRDYKIGNGGLSLRKVDKCVKVLRRHRAFTAKWKSNEDVFWSMLAPMLDPLFKIPNYRKGLGFAFEKKPSYFFKKNHHQLPFGVHAWDKHEPEFWKSIIDKLENGKGDVKIINQHLVSRYQKSATD